MVRDFDEAIFFTSVVHVVDGLFDHCLHGFVAVALAELFDLAFIDRQVVVDVTVEDLLCSSCVWAFDLDLHVEAAGTKDCGIDQIFTVRRTDHDDVFELLDAVDFGEQLRNDGRLHVRADAGTASSKQRVHFVEENDDRHTVFAFFACPLEDEANLPLGFSDVFVQKLWAFDVDEVRLLTVFAAALLTHFLCQRVGHRFRDQCFSAARRTIEKDSLRRRQLVFVEQVLVQKRKLDGVGDQLDL